MSEQGFKRIAGMVVIVILIIASLSIVFMLQARDIEVLSVGDSQFYYRLSGNLLKIIPDMPVAGGELEIMVVTNTGEALIDIPNNMPAGSMTVIEIPIEQFSVAERINLYYQGTIVHTWQME
ncbi:MAG: hypothetical protein GOU99_00860 [Candidatus Altiarchaeota archaeon]|nr:hypothetical protein [Candidatus Altiarchaeota archaeon]